MIKREYALNNPIEVKSIEVTMQEIEKIAERIYKKKMELVISLGIEPVDVVLPAKEFLILKRFWAHIAEDIKATELPSLVFSKRGKLYGLNLKCGTHKRGYHFTIKEENVLAYMDKTDNYINS